MCRRLLCVYIGWIISYRFALLGRVKDEDAKMIKLKNKAAANATLFLIWAYPAAYNIEFNALTYSNLPPNLFAVYLPVGSYQLTPYIAYLVELWPYALRARGMILFQLSGRKQSSTHPSSFILLYRVDGIILSQTP